MATNEKIKEILGPDKTEKKVQRKRAISTASISDVDIIPGIAQTPKRGRPPKKRKAVSVKKPVHTNRNSKRQLQTTYPLQNFESAENRNSIISWLNDNKNRFDRITQSQQTVSTLKCSQDSFDMPSVSQFKKIKEWTQLNQHPRARSSSLDAGNEVFQYEPRMRHNSWPCESKDLEDYLENKEYICLLLEEVRKTAMLKQKEEEFLNSIETEIEMKNKKENLKSVTLKETEQITEKTERPSKGDCKVVNDKKHKSFNPVVVLENMHVAENNKSYNLDVVEAYFRENISKITNEGADFYDESPKNKKISTVSKRITSTKKTDEAMNSNIVSTSESNETSSKNECVGATHHSTDEDYLFQMPTQKVILPSRKEESENESTFICVQDSKELIVQLENSVTRIELNSCNSNISEKCKVIKHHTAEIKKILGRIKSGEIFTNGLDGVDIPLMPSKANSVETQTEIVLVDAEVQTTKIRDEATPSVEFSQPFNGSLISKLVTKYGKSSDSIGSDKEVVKDQNANVSQENEPLSGSFDKISFDTQKLLKNLRNESVKDVEAANTVSRKYTFSNTLDDMDFETQRLVQNHVKPSSKRAQNIDLGSGSGRKQVNRRLDYSEGEKKKFKRIRTPSDSDSDSEIHEKKRNKYLQEDLSVHFESENPNAAKNANDCEFKFSDDINYNVSIPFFLMKFGHNSVFFVEDQVRYLLFILLR